MLSLVSILLVAAGLLGTCVSQLTPFGTSGTASSGLASTSRQAGYCSRQERRSAFNRCVMNFGMQHMNYFGFLARNRPVCRSEVFRCNEVDSLVRCLNSQPTTVVSNRCWIMMEDVLTQFLHDYNIPCSYADLHGRCVARQISTLKNVAERSSTGQGATINPMRAIYQRIAPMISMMVFAGFNGGMGGMFGA